MNQLILGDNLEVLRKIESDSIVATITKLEILIPFNK